MKSASESTLSSLELSLADKDSRMKRPKKKFVVSIVTAAILAFVAGMLIGNVSVSLSTRQDLDLKSSNLAYYESLVEESDSKWNDRILQEISADTIKSFLRNGTKNPRMAGTQSGRLEAERMKRLWMEHGIPDVKLNPYDVLLSYPDAVQPNSVSILNSSGEVLFQSTAHRFSNADLDLGRKISPPFNAFSGSGDVTGDLVYLNFGFISDFKYVTEKLKIDLTGKILLIKYGFGSRGKKAMLAQKYNASGVIFYSDPQNHVLDGSPVYPDSLNLPPDGAQRGSLSRVRSDILTQGYPATEYAYRISIKEAEELLSFPKIPVFPIGYGDAIHLLREIGGEPSPVDWKGALNVSYNIGPGLKDNKTVRLIVGNLKSRRVINNVVGIIPGSIEPDRYVVLGNHRDSWTYGGSDPGSGTACLVELTRVFGKLYKDGWRPRRTLMFISWDAEEYSYVGSAEWIEEHRFILDRAVTYINIDQAVTGTMSFISRATPSVRNVIYNVTKRISNPDMAEVKRGRKTVYDTWSVKRPDGSRINPRITMPNGGSDFYPFMHILGIPVADFRYCNEKLSNPLYHTRFETFDMQANIIDPEFLYHKSITQIWAMLATAFTEPLVIPFKLEDFIPVLTDRLATFEEAFSEILKRNRISLRDLRMAFQTFFSAVKTFEETKRKVCLSKNPFLIRRINDQMMAVERAFISIDNGSNRMQSQNVVLSSFFGYKKLPFEPLSGALSGISDSDEKQWNIVKKQISILTYHLQSAALILKDVKQS